MPRIAYVSFDQVPAPKGASTHIEAFVRGLGREFGEVDLVTVGTDAEGLERWPGVRHWELPAMGKSLIDRVRYFQAGLSRWLAARSYDVIQFRSPFEGLPIVRGRKGAALIFEVNGLPSIELKYRYPGCEDDRELMAKLIAQERYCVAAANAIVTPSAVTREFLMASRGAREVTVIPNGVDLSVFQPGSGGGGFLYFGTLSAWQGVDLAIRAVARVPGSSLTILGTGNKRQREALLGLAAKLGAAVTLREPVSQVALAEEIARCEAVLAPLVWNDRNVVQGCCPLKVLEGMAAGRPVITSDLRVVRDLGVRDGDHLLMTKPGSVDGIVEAMGRVDGSIGARGRRLVEERFTWDHAVGRLIEVFSCL